MINNKEIILYSDDFVADDKLINFANELGYTDIKDINCRMDKKIINFIKNNSNELDNHKIYKGKSNENKKHGFNGFAFIKNVDTSRLWTISNKNNRYFNSLEYHENILYLNLYQQKDNYIEIN